MVAIKVRSLHNTPPRNTAAGTTRFVQHRGKPLFLQRIRALVLLADFLSAVCKQSYPQLYLFFSVATPSEVIAKNT